MDRESQGVLDPKAKSAARERLSAFGAATFNYDDNGRLERELVTAGVDEKTYVFDAVYRLTNITAVASGQSTQTSFDHDSGGDQWRLGPELLGEVGSRRQELYEKGIAIDLGTTNVLLGVVSGGAEGDVLDKEWGMVVFYNIALTPWLQLTPSVQYAQPGLKSIDHTTTVRTRLQIYF